MIRFQGVCTGRPSLSRNRLHVWHRGSGSPRNMEITRARLGWDSRTQGNQATRRRAAFPIASTGRGYSVYSRGLLVEHAARLGSRRREPVMADRRECCAIAGAATLATAPSKSIHQWQHQARSTTTSAGAPVDTAAVRARCRRWRCQLLFEAMDALLHAHAQSLESNVRRNTSGRPQP